MTITIQFDGPDDVARLIDALRASGAFDDVTDRATRRVLDEVGIADGYRRAEVLSQSARAWSWLTPRTREVVLTAATWRDGESEVLLREIDEAVGRWEERRRQRFVDVAAQAEEAVDTAQSVAEHGD